MSDADAGTGDEQPVAEDNVTVLPVLTAPGGRLRAAREAKGLAIGQVVEALRVEQRLVEAMEANEFAAFDAPVYARGFVRKYAQFLDLSPEEMLAELDALSGGPSAPTLVPRTTAAPRVRDWSRISATLGAIGGGVLVLGSFLWFHERAPREQAATPAAAPAVTAAPAVAPATMDAVAPAAPAPASPEPASTSPVPAPGVATGVAPALPAPAPAAAPAAAATGVAPAAAEAGHGHLELDVRGDSWVEVYGADGARKVYGMLHAGDRRSVVGPGPWRVLLGRADSVHVSLDGAAVVASAEHRKGDTAFYHLDAHGTQY